MDTIYIQCGCCGHLHREDYHGDCRNDDERFSFDQLEAMEIPEENIVDFNDMEYM